MDAYGALTPEPDNQSRSRPLPSYYSITEPRELPVRPIQYYAEVVLTKKKHDQPYLYASHF
jgi:hypothetical protein